MNPLLLFFLLLQCQQPNDRCRIIKIGKPGFYNKERNIYHYPTQWEFDCSNVKNFRRLPFKTSKGATIFGLGGWTTFELDSIARRICKWNLKNQNYNHGK